jgi:hypothetical protein
VNSSLDRAHGLVIFNSYLYFINTPPSGSDVKIERVSLSDPSDRQQVAHPWGQIPFSLTVLCGRLYWADYKSKSVYEVELGQSQTSSPRLIFKSSADHVSTYAVERRVDLDAISCLERHPIPIEPPALTESPVEVEVHSQPPATVSSTTTPSSLLQLTFCETSTCSNGATCVSLDSEAFCL